MFLLKNRLKLLVVISYLVLLNLILLIVNRISQSSNIQTSIESPRNWHENRSIRAALSRFGLGEVGSAEKPDELYKEYGYNAALSDQIPLDRSVPDVRPEESIHYLAQLPRAAIIIIFYNERLSVLLRTLYGIQNRTPNELIQEIIMVDDGSTSTDLQLPLVKHLGEHFPPTRCKVRLLRLPKRSGIMVARMAGARAASFESEVLIFMDSHFEVNYNWLPPLLEPIALNPKACTVPALDRIGYDTFDYQKTETVRGYFDWQLGYQMRPVHKAELARPTKNFREYVMMGGAMAISVEFFWHLGGFDEGMVYWGGEQYEMSFKIWMCGGELINVPCSRIGHVFRNPHTNGNTNLYGNYNFTEKNFRRLVDVWLDEEHRQYVIDHRPAMKTVNPGDLTERFALRERLQCKSFSWMLEHIMPDLKEIFPPIEPNDYGYGTIHSKLDKNSCIAINELYQVILTDCNHKNNSEERRKYWHYTWRCELRNVADICLEHDILNMAVNTFGCHRLGGNQKWYYDHKKQWIRHLEQNVCMFANFKKRRIGLTQCRGNNLNMKWGMEFYNQTASNECKKPMIVG